MNIICMFPTCHYQLPRKVCCWATSFLDDFCYKRFRVKSKASIHAKCWLRWIEKWLKFVVSGWEGEAWTGRWQTSRIYVERISNIPSDHDHGNVLSLDNMGNTDKYTGVQVFQRRKTFSRKLDFMFLAVRVIIWNLPRKFQVNFVDKHFLFLN